MTCFGIGGASSGRALWNQFDYHVTNILDDSSIPRIEAAPWLAPVSSWGAQASADGACCSADARPPLTDQTICLGDTATLDASSLTLSGCAGSTSYEWRDTLGIVASTARTDVTPAQSTTYQVTATCSSSPACISTGAVTVFVRSRPQFATAAARDLSACTLGIEVTWEPATFENPVRGAYNVYRSDDRTGLSCGDATSRAPVALDLTGVRWVDTTTELGRTYVYVVEAEDGIATTACAPPPPGPARGAPVTRVCIEPGIADLGDARYPVGVYATLRVRHVGQLVTLDWSRARALLAGEHFHLLKAWSDPSSFSRVNPEGDTALEHVETDTTTRLQFFDLRVANACEDQSADEFPPGLDDRDRDGIANHLDNCPDIANPDQLDADMNGVGDACP